MHFMAKLATSVWLLATLLSASVSASVVDIDLNAADGTKLKATYASPGGPNPGKRPGKRPGMLLIHQCNMDRTMWQGIATQLTDAGVYVLAMDLRGFGDSAGEGMGGAGGFPAFMQSSSADVDLAFTYLTNQAGVDPARIAVGGASCGAMLTAGLASRRSGIKALMLLSGPPSDDAVAHIARTPGLAVFAAAARDDTIVPDVAKRLQSAVDGSPHPSSVARIYDGAEHGLPMFDKNVDLEPALLAWLKHELLVD